MTARGRLSILILLFIASIGGQSCHAETVMHYRGTDSSLTERWKWGLSQIQKNRLQNGCWIGYSIEHRMGLKSFIGTFNSDWRKNRPTLMEVLTGMRDIGLDDRRGDDQSTNDVRSSVDDEERGENMVVKEIGLLFHFGSGESIDDIQVSNLSLHVDLGGDALVWLGTAQRLESLAHLISLYKDVSSDEIKKRFIMAIGIHEGSDDDAVKFLKNVLQSSEHSGVREDAAFWLGQTHSSDALNILLTTAMSDRSESIRERAVFSISEMKRPASTEALITIAKNNEHKETRKNAIFWLGQQASNETLGALKDLTDNDKDADIQKSALFALTQSEKDGGVDALIEIAKHHKNPKLRKEAIFWLGQNDDPKALDALVEIVRNEPQR